MKTVGLSEAKAQALGPVGCGGSLGSGPLIPRRSGRCPPHSCTGRLRRLHAEGPRLEGRAVDLVRELRDEG